MNILIAGAWPYANGSLHIGHIAAPLPSTGDGAERGSAVEWCQGNENLSIRVCFAALCRACRNAGRQGRLPVGRRG